MTKRYAVLGSPISHSLSPQIHKHCFSRLSIDAQYQSFEVAENLAAFLLQHPELSGVSVTTPLKDEAFSLAKNLSELALKTKSVNTLIRTKTGWDGFNTDVFGIKNAIATEPASVAVLGSGATARSALAAFPDSDLMVFGRNPDATAALSSEFDAQSVTLERALMADAVISTLPKGVLPDLLKNQTRPKILLDAAYQNPQLPAEKYVSGLEMLIHQAIYQQRIFNSGNQEQPLNNEAELVSELRALVIVAK